MKGHWLILAAVLAVGASAVHGATPGFQGLGVGSLPYEVAGDGSKVVGRVDREAAFWQADGGWTKLGFTGFAYGASGDGSVITGWTGSSSSTISSNKGFRWTQETGVELLPSPANQGLAISADGSTIVGEWGTGWSNRHPFRHTPAEGTIDLTTVPGMPFPGGARGVSGDGTIMVGWSDLNGWLWQAADNSVTLLNKPNQNIYPWALSADGTTAVGVVGVDGVGGAGYWRSGEGVRLVLPVSVAPGVDVRDVTADGRTLTGYYDNPTQCAFIWDKSHGPRTVAVMLEQEIGLDLTGWWLRWACISDDGMTLAGAGYNPLGQSEGWVAVIPEPATLSLLAAGLAAVWMRKRRVTR